MGAKGYSAGTIFLQVVPVFKDVQREIADQAKDIDRALGDQMEKAGREAGKRGGKAASEEMSKEVEKGAEKSAKQTSTIFEREFKSAFKGIQKDIDDIDVKRLPTDLRREFSELKKEIGEISKVDLFDDRALKKARGDIENIAGGLRRLQDNSKITLKGNFDSVEKGLRKVATQVDKFREPIDIEVRTAPAERVLSSFEKRYRQTAKRTAEHLSGAMSAEVKKIRAYLDSLQDEEIGITISAAAARADLQAIQRDLERISREDPDLSVRVDAGQALAELAAFDSAISKIDGRDIDINTKPAERAMSAFEAKFKRSSREAAEDLSGSMNDEVKKVKAYLESLQDEQIGVTISAEQARAELNAIERDLERISMEDPDLDVRIATSTAMAKLAAFEAAVSKADGREIDVDVDVDTHKSQRAFSLLARNGDVASNTFRSFNIIALAVAGLGPALIPVLAGIGGALLAIGPAAGVAAAGLGAVLVGFSGIGDAVKALSDRQKEQASTAADAATKNKSAARAIEDAQRALADAERNAARAAEDAAERVADAREAAADAVEDALDRQRDAQERYRDSIEDVRDAEQALREARAGVGDRGAGLDRDIRGNELAIDQALLSSFNATVAYNATQEDGSATNAEQEQARINMEEAKLRLEELRAERKELAAEKRKWDKEGIDGTEEVQSAQEQLNDAIEAQKDAYEGVRDAAAEVDEARAEGAERVAEAIEDQNRVLADNARAIEDARRNLARAREGQDDLNESISSQQEAVNEAMDALGPAGRRFARFLFGLRAEFRAFRDDVQEIMLPSIQDAIEGFMGSSNAGVARSALIGLAGAFGLFAEQLSTSLQGEAWGDFFEMLAEYGPPIMEAYGGAFIKFMEAMASIMTILAPFALEFAEGFERMMTAFAGWAASEDAAKGFEGFLDYVREVGPQVLDFVGAFFRALANVAEALAPYAEVVLALVVGFLELLANNDAVAAIAAILTTLLVLITASQVAYGIMSLMLAGAALLGSTLGLVIFVAVALGLAMAYLWTHSEGFRDFMTEAWERIAKATSEAWENSLKPALERFGEVLKQVWDEILVPFFAWFGPILLRFIEWYIPALAAYWAAAIDLIGWAIKNIAIPSIKFLAGVVIWLWKYVVKPSLKAIAWVFEKTFDAISWYWNNILKPVFNAWAKVLELLYRLTILPILKAIGEAWEVLSDAMEWVWRKVLKPIFDAFGEKVLPKLKSAFETTIDAIKKVWEGMKEVVAKPIKFVIERVLNDGLIAGFNKVAGWVGMDGFDDIEVPASLRAYKRGGIFGADQAQAYAGGGVLPGYTPGRDVHRFVSPTAGRLELSGGEAIMRPEWTALMGPGYINEMNRLARTGGVNGLRRAMSGQGFAGGGIFYPLPGARTDTYAGHDGVDLNVGSGWDDYGMPFYSATPGRVTSVGYSRGYGNAVFVASPYGELVYGHSAPGSIVVRPGQSVRPGEMLARVGNTGNSSAPHLHFGFPGSTYMAAMSLLAGSLKGDPAKMGEGQPTKSIPGGIMSIIKDPLGAVKDWVLGPIKDAAGSFADSDFFGYLKKAPMTLAEKTADKVLDIVPGWAKSAAGWAVDAGKAVVGGVKSVGSAVASGAEAVGDFLGLADGGILPYNGTMMYDDGGYLPPGLTTVMNLTGKPEPVFTDDQWGDIEVGGSGETYHYEPHFEGSDLTANEVAGDMNFEFRKMRRRGKYAREGRP